MITLSALIFVDHCVSTLSNAQKRYLKGLAHHLKPVVLLGNKGLTEAVVAEINQALDIHELIKVKVVAADRMLRDECITSICSRTEAALVSRIGNIASLYRRATKPMIILPKA